MIDEPEQLSFAAMPRRLFACTPSRLAGFDCPRWYRFTYVERLPGLPRAASTIGAVAHLALQQWWTLPRPRRVPEQARDLVSRNWTSAGFRDEQQAARARDLVVGWVAGYLGAHAADEPVGVERTVAARTARLALSGRVDRIDERDGELVVVDYKTGRRVPTVTDAAASAALALYVIGVRQTLHRPCRRVELHHLPSGTIAAFEHTERTLAEHVVRAERTADAIEAATGADRFPPAPGPSCGRCAFRRQCPEGRAASTELPLWAGLPDELS